MSKRILIVDDDPHNIFALRLTLKARKYQLESCMMADEAIRILKEDNDFCVVLMDMMMPEMDGYEAIKIIRNTPDISKVPIIAVTAQAMEEDRQKCLEAGAQDLLLTAIEKHC